MQSWLLVSCVMCDVSESSLDLNLSYCIENMSLTHNILVDARRLPVWSKATPLGWWTHLKIMKRGQRPYLHWVILRGFNPLIASRVPNPIRSGTCGSPGLPGKFFGDLLCKNTSQIHLNTTEISACPIFPLEKSSISFIQGGRYCLSKKIWWMNKAVKLGFTPKGRWIWSFRHTVDSNHGTGAAPFIPKMVIQRCQKYPQNMGEWSFWFCDLQAIPKHPKVLRSWVFYTPTRICSMGWPYPLGDWQLQCRPWCHTCIHV